MIKAERVKHMMRKTKAKHEARNQTQMLPFVVVWALSIVSTSYIDSALMRTLLYPFLTSELAAAASNFVPVLLTGLIQAVLTERLLKRPMRGWMLYTAVSGFITLFLIHGVARSMFYGQNPNFSSDLYMLVNSIAFY